MTATADLLRQAIQRHTAGDLAGAEQRYRQVLAAQADHPDATNLLAQVLCATGRQPLDLELARRAVVLRPEIAAFHNTLGTVLQANGQDDNAVSAYERALQLEPNNIDAVFNLAVLFHQQKLLDRALATITANGELFQHARVCNLAGELLLAAGDAQRAVSMFQAALERDPGSKTPLFNAWSAIQFFEPPSFHQAAAQLRQVWWNRHASRIDTLDTLPNPPAPGKVLHLGIVSPFFRQHVCGSFCREWIGRIDKSQFRVTCFSDLTDAADGTTQQIRDAADAWHDVSLLANEQTAAEIRSQEIDILISLGLHGRESRLEVLEYKPAPVVVVAVGPSGDCLLSDRAVDWVLADDHVLAADACTHPVLRMPDDYICFSPHPGMPDVGPPPSDSVGVVTFGSLSHPARLNDELIAVWCRILQAVERSRLILRYAHLDSQICQQRIRSSFERHGVGADRVECLGGAPFTDFMTTYNRIDIALDPFPSSGGLTTCESLFMGVPVVTQAGGTFAGRLSTSHLTNAGLPDLVTVSPQEYIETAVGLAADGPRRAELRRGLRNQVRNSPLGDGARYASNLQRRLRACWKSQMSGGSSNSPAR